MGLKSLSRIHTALERHHSLTATEICYYTGIPAYEVSCLLSRESAQPTGRFNEGPEKVCKVTGESRSSWQLNQPAPVTHHYSS